MARTETERRRARRRVVGGAAALAFAVVAGGTLFATSVFDGGPPRPDGNVPAAVDVPTAPGGKRLVGMGRVVVTVPLGWHAYGLRGCEPAAESTIWFEQETEGLDLDCPSVAYEAPTVKLSTLDSDGGQQAAKFATRPRLVGGVEVFRELVTCPDDGFCVGDIAVRYLVIPSEGVAITVIGPMRQHRALDAIADSVQVLPTGYTTVPYVSGNYAAGGPAPGSVVAVGSTVTLYPSGP